MTTSDGYTYGVDGTGRLRACDASKTVNVNYFELVTTWCKNEDGTGDLVAEDYAKIGADDTGVTFNITHANATAGRIRLAQGSSEPTVSGTTLRATASVKATWAASVAGAAPVVSLQVKVGEGSFAAYPTNKIYYSIAGQLTSDADVSDTTTEGYSAVTAANADMTKALIDAKYKDTVVDADTSLGNKLQLSIA